MAEMSLRQLEVLVAVVETGSFTEAGKRLYLAQSTISGHIRELENALGVRLFRREAKKNVRLTSSGRGVYRYAKDILARCKKLESEMEFNEDRELLIGASTVPSHALIPAWLTAFSKENPDCCCRLLAGDSTRTLQKLLDNEIQLAFVGQTIHRSSLESVAVAEDRLVLITENSERFRRLKQDGVPGSQLLSEPLILREEGSGTLKRIEEYLEELNVDVLSMRVRARMELSRAIIASVRRGMGVSIISNLLVEEDVRRGTILQFELEDRPLSRKFFMLRDRKDAPTALAEAFWNFVLTHSQEDLNLQETSQTSA